MEKVPILKADNLTKTFGSGALKVTAVNQVNLAIAPGEIVLIMGPSGSGKTTLLSMLGGLLRPTEGQVNLQGVSITNLSEAELPDIRAQKVGFIFQAFNLLDALSVKENIEFPGQLINSSKSEKGERVNLLIKKLGLTHRKNALPATLSGGEKQRVAIARALVNHPPLILADEPTGNLDSQSGQEVLMLLHEIAKNEGCGVLIVTHDPRVEELADRILWLEDGKLSDKQYDQHHWVHCPVCNMKVDQWTAQHKSTWKTVEYVFCSETCLDKFIHNPDTYVSNN